MPKKIDVDFEEVEALATKGYTAAMIFDAIGVSHSKGYHDIQIKQAIKRGHTTAKQKVVNDLMERSESDQSSAATIFLAKQLKVFNDPFPTSSPKSPADALKKITNIYVAVAENKLSEDKGTALIGYLEKYVKSYEVSELEERITKLEKIYDEQK